jgi:DNA-binding response OmpR family regulator
MAKILIVEDESDIGELYRLSLETAGHSIVGIYEDPVGPLRDAFTLPAPDLVIMDERLGVHSGSEFLSKYRLAFRNARILLVSADLETVKEGVARGFDKARRKPITLRHLVENIADLLKEPQPRISGPGP